jgi:uncharacterized membrane protein
VYTTLDYPGATSTSANGINDVGQIVGTTLNFAFQYDIATQTFTEIKFPGTGTITSAQAINNSDTITGALQNSNDGTFLGFRLTQGTYRKLLPAGFTRSSAAGINNNGDILCNAGSNTQSGVFLFNHGQFHALQVPAGSAVAYGINDNRTFVGAYVAQTGATQGFISQKGGFQPLVFPHSLSTLATGINNSGAVVGYFLHSIVTHGFTWTP